MSTPLRLLIVEDCPDDADLAIRALTAAGYEIEACRVDTETCMVKTLESAEFDLVVSDFTLPHFGAEAALRIAHAAVPDLPFVLVSGVIGEEAAFRLVRAGADEFVAKNRLDSLPQAVERSLAAAGERRHRRRAEQEALERLAELERFQRLTVGRELKMVELKRRIADLERRLASGDNDDGGWQG